MNIIKELHRETSISENTISKVLSFLNEGATIPFIARYRKEVTGGLDEVQLIALRDRHHFWVEFSKRKETVLNSIEEQGRLTDILRKQIEQSITYSQLEDLYLPFKQKRKTKGQKAIEQGLKPLAISIQKEFKDSRIEQRAESFVRGNVESIEDALSGAISILSEWIAEDARLRERIREQFQKFGVIASKVKKGKESQAQKFRDYFDFSERLNRIPAHRILALFRAEKEDLINLKIKVDKEKAIQNIERAVFRRYSQNTYVHKAIEESYKRILQPNFESELKKELRERADIESITVFAKNLKQLLLQSPLGGKSTLAIDPGFRTGCKVVVLNNRGDFIENTTIFPHEPQNKKAESEQILRSLLKRHSIEVIAVGDATAGLETLNWCEQTFTDSGLQIFEVSEAGASVYSASEIAREEFSELDLTVRGAISIGRRLMDPLAELVKVDPKSIGVGQYQHDVNQVLLKQKLDEVTEFCVNHVGVDLNTASFPILTHVSGLGPIVAKSIVDFRKSIGSFKERKELLKVPKLGSKSFEQCAGFLRIKDGLNPLDNTIIHPESYELAQKLKSLLNSGIDKKSILENHQTEFGKTTIEMVLRELERPTIDPREPLEAVERNSVSSISDLYNGMVLNGTVNNITKFGAFVNIGVKESGLVHVSEISNTFITDIHQFLELGQRIKVRVLKVDLERKRIQLTIKGV
jgi:uncharacterized protein